MWSRYPPACLHFDTSKNVHVLLGGTRVCYHAQLGDSTRAEARKFAFRFFFPDFRPNLGVVFDLENGVSIFSHFIDTLLRASSQLGY